MRKIAIVGAAKTRRYAPFGKKGWELWSLNNLFVAFEGKKFHRWFELHKFERKKDYYIFTEYYRRGIKNYSKTTVKEYMQNIAALNIPVYMQQKWNIIPKSQVFPFEEIMKVLKTKNFGCSFAWMLAQAILEHIKGDKIHTIGLYGVELSGREYYLQRASTDYFIGMAKGMGINIQIPKDSSIGKTPFLYAYDENFKLIEELFINTENFVTFQSTLHQQTILREFGDTYVYD